MNKWGVARFLPDGSLDTSFDSDGWLTTDFAGADSVPADVAVANDGRIVVAGIAGSSGSDFAISVFNGGKQRLYAQQDASFNVTSIADDTGAVQERYLYDPYGAVTYKTAAWGAKGASSYSWVYLHQGGRYDGSSKLYSFRERDRGTVLGRWVQQDPAGFVDGANLYQFVSGNPDTYLDPYGLAFLYGYSGIIRVDTNYIDDYLQQWGHRTNTEPWMHSNVGAFDIALGSVASKTKLDDEARRLASNQRPGDKCGKVIRVLMLAPKTTTLPPTGGCCDIQFTVLWSDRDPVPNQGPFEPNSQSFWKRYAPGRTYNIQPWGHHVGAHGTDSYLRSPPLRVRFGDAWRRPTPHDPVRRAPDAEGLVRDWMTDPNVNEVMVCHSQGCNIMMKALQRACKKCP